MDDNQKSMLQFILVMLIASIIFMLVFMLLNDSFTKAQIYDHYKGLIDMAMNCTVTPICICGG